MESDFSETPEASVKYPCYRRIRDCYIRCRAAGIDARPRSVHSAKHMLYPILFHLICFLFHRSTKRCTGINVRSGCLNILAMYCNERDPAAFWDNFCFARLWSSSFEVLQNYFLSLPGLFFWHWSDMLLCVSSVSTEKSAPQPGFQCKTITVHHSTHGNLRRAQDTFLKFN